jgi:integrase
MRLSGHRKSGYVFAASETEHITDVKNPFRTALKRAKLHLAKAGKKEEADALDRFRFHDLRHTAASWLAMGGAGLPAIQKFLRHASLKMTLRYAHLSPDCLGQEARILDQMLPSRDRSQAQSEQRDETNVKDLIDGTDAAT